MALLAHECAGIKRKMGAMGSSEAAEVVRATEHLLWVLAAPTSRIFPPRGAICSHGLDELERRAADLNIPDLYRQVLLRCQ